MESFPKNKTQLETFWLDKISSGGSFLLLVLVFALVIFNFKTLPDIIPVHFNFLGEADRFSGKESVWLLPVRLQSFKDDIKNKPEKVYRDTNL